VKAPGAKKIAIGPVDNMISNVYSNIVAASMAMQLSLSLVGKGRSLRRLEQQKKLKKI
jgi:hypothetical protein